MTTGGWVPSGRVPAYQELADLLRERILAGELGSGERLPTEPELSAQYGLSRSTVREALRVLASQNLVTTMRGVSGGSFVAYPRPDQISGYLEVSLGLLALSENLTVDMLLEARDLLEVPAARLAAGRRTAAQVDDLRETLFDPRSVADPAVIFLQNRNFHSVLLRASGNPLLELLAQPVFRVLHGRFLRERAPSEFWVRVDEDHRVIFAAIEAGDQRAAEEATREHLRHLRSTYLQIDRAGPGPGDDLSAPRPPH